MCIRDSSYSESGKSLKSTSNFFGELQEFNAARYIPQRLYLVPSAPAGEGEYEGLFALADYYREVTKQSERAADWLALGLARTQLKDTEAAVKAFDKALELYPDFAMAYMARAYARSLSADTRQHTLAIADYDRALRINPRLVLVQQGEHPL